MVGVHPQKRHPLQDFGSEIGGGPIPRNRGWAYTQNYTVMLLTVANRECSWPYQNPYQTSYTTDTLLQLGREYDFRFSAKYSGICTVYMYLHAMEQSAPAHETLVIAEFLSIGPSPLFWKRTDILT